MLAYSQNGRMDRGTWRMRAGASIVSSGVNLPQAPLLVDGFSIVADIPILTQSYANGYAYVETTVPHSFSNFQLVYIKTNGNEAYNGDAVITVDSPTKFHYAENPNRRSEVVIGQVGAYANGGPVISEGPQILASCSYANESDNAEGIVIVGQSSAYLYTENAGVISLNYPFLEKCSQNSENDALQYLNSIYIFRGFGSTQTLHATTSTTQALFQSVSTLPMLHGLSSGSWVKISDASSRRLEGVFLIEAIVDDFTFIVRSTNNDFPFPINGAITVREALPVLRWDMDLSHPFFKYVDIGNSPLGANYINMPPVDWGASFKGRMILPLSKDEIVLSDILDPDTYDLSFNQFRMLPGSADWLVAIAPFQQDKFLILYRKSVHIVQVDDTLAISQSAELTRAFGCCARRTAIDCGQYLLWLSDIGIMRMNVTDFITLKNDTRPLSDPINDIIDTINWTYASTSIGKYWNNRAYFAVPTNGSTVNNTVIVYNFLNEQWESVDAYPTAINIAAFHAINKAGKQRLHAVSPNGFIYLLEEVDGVDETIITMEDDDMMVINTQPIAAYMTTRSYMANTFDVKTVKRCHIEASGATGGTVTAEAILHNPDVQTSPESFVRTVGNNDVSIRNSINRRGNAVQMKVSTTVSSSDIKAVAIEGRVSNRTTIDRE
jgi:hypothetical protein